MRIYHVMFLAVVVVASISWQFRQRYSVVNEYHLASLNQEQEVLGDQVELFFRHIEKLKTEQHHPPEIESRKVQEGEEESVEDDIPLMVAATQNQSRALLTKHHIEGKYLLFSPYGQHNNQLITLMRALNIAHRLNRTLIIPPFARKKGKDWFHAYQLYDFTAFHRSPFRIVFQDEFFAAYAPTDPWEAIACFVPTAASKPKASENMAPLRLRCGATVVVDNQNTAAFLIDRIRQQGHRFAYIGQAFFFDDARPLRPCPWSFLELNAEVKQEVVTFQKRLPAQYLAVHVRSMSGSCRGRQVLLSKRLNISRNAQEQYAKQCEMSTEYVLSFAREKDKAFFLATDDQNPKATRELLQAGAVRYAGRYHPKSIPAILMDLFIMSEAEVFVGNGASSFSMNVCRLRLAHHRDCNNFLPHRAARHTGQGGGKG